LPVYRTVTTSGGFSLAARGQGGAAALMGVGQGSGEGSGVVWEGRERAGTTFIAEASLAADGRAVDVVHRLRGMRARKRWVGWAAW
jgi:hypothetical protein